MLLCHIDCFFAFINWIVKFQDGHQFDVMILFGGNHNFFKVFVIVIVHTKNQLLK